MKLNYSIIPTIVLLMFNGLRGQEWNVQISESFFVFDLESYYVGIRNERQLDELNRDTLNFGSYRDDPDVDFMLNSKIRRRHSDFGITLFEDNRFKEETDTYEYERSRKMYFDETNCQFAFIYDGDFAFAGIHSGDTILVDYIEGCENGWWDSGVYYPGDISEFDKRERLSNVVDDYRRQEERFTSYINQDPEQEQVYSIIKSWVDSKEVFRSTTFTDFGYLRGSQTIYDDMGNVIESIRIRQDGPFQPTDYDTSIYVNHYIDNLLVKQDGYSYGSISRTTHFCYDCENRLTSEEIISDGRTVSSVKYFYNTSPDCTNITNPIALSLKANPVGDVLKIEVNRVLFSPVDIKIFSLSGKFIDLPWDKSFQFEYEVDVSSLPAGQYFVSIITDKDLVTKAFVKM